MKQTYTNPKPTNRQIRLITADVIALLLVSALSGCGLRYGDFTLGTPQIHLLANKRTAAKFGAQKPNDEPLSLHSPEDKKRLADIMRRY